MFDAQGTGVLSFSNVLMGAGVERDGLGHDPVRGRHQPRRARRGLCGRDHGARQRRHPRLRRRRQHRRVAHCRRWHAPRRRHADRRQRPVLARAGQFRRGRHDRLQRQFADDHHRHRRFLRCLPHVAAERDHDVVGAAISRSRTPARSRTPGCCKPPARAVAIFGGAGRKCCGRCRGRDRGLGLAVGGVGARE